MSLDARTDFDPADVLRFFIFLLAPLLPSYTLPFTYYDSLRRRSSAGRLASTPPHPPVSANSDSIHPS